MDQQSSEPTRAATQTVLVTSLGAAAGVLLGMLFAHLKGRYVERRQRKPKKGK